MWGKINVLQVSINDLRSQEIALRKPVGFFWVEMVSIELPALQACPQSVMLEWNFVQPQSLSIIFCFSFEAEFPLPSS